MIRRAIPVALAAGIALLAIAPAHADPVAAPVAEVVDSPDIQREGERFRHRASGYVFPSSIGDMPARKLVVYGPGDVSVQYTVDGGAAGDAWVDIYVYPAGELTIEDTAADIVAAITNSFKATPSLAPRGFAVRTSDAQSGWFDGQFGQRSVKTGFYVVKRGEWLIKIRASMPSPPTQQHLTRTAAAVSAVNLGPLPTRQ